MFPAASVARTKTRWEPRSSDAYVFGERQDCQRPRSSRHWNVARSVARKRTATRCAAIARAGPATIRVSGGVASVFAGVRTAPGSAAVVVVAVAVVVTVVGAATVVVTGTVVVS